MKADTFNMMYHLISTLGILACFIPIIILFKRKLWKEKIYVFIGIYWLLNGSINLTTLFHIKINPVVEDYITIISNYIDLPLVLYIFYLASEGMHKIAIKYTFFLFILFELIVTMIKGFNYSAVTIILGVNLMVIIVFSIVGIITYLTKIDHTPKENMMVFMYSSFLFFYGSFIIVYYFSYLTNIGSDSDNFLLYYLELLLASAPAIYGMTKYARTYTVYTRVKMDGF